ncbi:unnamed protein product [Arabis nemorensis]|uniref:Uncharacterized protein n=1 Tax=Arabis nemorensis TaxID=586526 RepID=A0A565CHU4_9BRAS|nr:unnamed protein product [Arabis nemorensis]
MGLKAKNTKTAVSKTECIAETTSLHVAGLGIANWFSWRKAIPAENSELGYSVEKSEVVV